MAAIDASDLPGLKSAAMKKLLAILLLAAAATTAAAQTDSKPASRYEAFPVGGSFRSPVADPAEPRVLLSRLKIKREAGEFSAGYASVGYDFGLLRRQGARPDDGWQVSVFGSADSLFNLDLPGDALVNTDYRFGVPVSWRGGALSARGRFYHQSSHLGDELILGGNAPRRIDLSFEAVDALLAAQYGGWRVYGGGSYVVRSSTTSYEGGGAQVGADFVGSAALIAGLRFTGGVDVKWHEAADWRSGTSVKLGLMAGRFSPDRRGVTLLAEYYDGFAPFGQFFTEDMKYYGVALQFDF
jgi:hypothetical protein